MDGLRTGDQPPHRWHDAALTTLTALCGGSCDLGSGEYVGDQGRRKCYLATDHLSDPSFARLTTDDVLDLVQEQGHSRNPDARTGVVIRMASAISAMGTIGVTAIAYDTGAAYSLFDQVPAALLAAAAAAFL